MPLLPKVILGQEKRLLGPSNARRRRRRGGVIEEQPPPPRPAEAVQPTHHTASIDRKCKNLFREIVEEFSIARRDSMNFVLLVLSQWLNTQQTELVHENSLTQQSIQNLAPTLPGPFSRVRCT
ncbi:hypothetical protein EDC94DRAFT_661335 [Helicostylum pulchrum]|nr:hypothetical protein EDC94DRAFT_661335 [Helicostylum pulchrum]